MLYIIFTNFIVFFLILFLIRLKKKHLIKYFSKFYEKHNYNRNILPFGGLALITVIILNYQYINFEILITSFFIFILGLSSDFRFIKSPSLRFLLMTVILSIYIYTSDFIISSNNFPLISDLMNNGLFNFIFLLICILIIINGTNFIDGINNNLNIYFLLLNLVITFLKYFHQIDFNFNLILILFSFIFLFFNYKNILMFGDGGAYLIGFLSAIELILITNQVQVISKYLPILLLFYPSYEVLFSVIRKRNKSPFYPDINHIHLLLIKYNKTNHLLTSLQINSLNIILFFLGAIYHQDDIILMFLIFTAVIIYNYFHNYLSR